MASIRPIAVGLPVRDGHVLVLDGFDSVKRGPFHRAIGGGIEFGETAADAVRREFLEELDLTLEDVDLLGVVENIFVHEGAPGHEIAFVFAVRSTALDAIPLDATLAVLDEGSPVRWLDMHREHAPIYPEGVEAIVAGLARSE